MIEHLQDIGYDAVDVDALLPLDYRGFIPAEIITKTLGIKKIVCEQSSTLLNMSNLEGMELIADVKVFEAALERGGVVYERLTTINEHLQSPIKIVS